MMKYLPTLFLLALFWLPAQAQYIPLSGDIRVLAEKLLATRQQAVHSSLRMAFHDSLYTLLTDSVVNHRQRQSMPTGFWARKGRYESLVQLKQPAITLHLNPLLHLQYTADRNSDSSFTQNTRGIYFYGRVGNHIRYYSSFHENQAYFPGYIDSRVQQRRVVPGQGVHKIFGEEADKGYDFSQAAGAIDFRLPGAFYLQLGQGKHFIGQGYRSLLLSDNTSNYPYMQVRYQKKHRQWAYWLTELQSFRGKYYNYHHKKHASFFYVSYMPQAKWEFSLFQSVIWQTGTPTRTKDIPAGLWVPLPLWQVAAYGLDGRHQVALGSNIRWQPHTNLALYAQALLDQWSMAHWSDLQHVDNRYALQLGTILYDVWNGRWPHHSFTVRAEYNMARPFTYSHEIATQAYTHLNQALAHPLGAGFHEGIAIARYHWRDISIFARYSLARLSKDTTDTHWGNNLYRSDQLSIASANMQQTTIGQGKQQTLQHWQAQLRYLINPAYNFYIFAGIKSRVAITTEHTSKANYVVLGLRTALSNVYYDF